MPLHRTQRFAAGGERHAWALRYNRNNTVHIGSSRRPPMPAGNSLLLDAGGRRARFTATARTGSSSKFHRALRTPSPPLPPSVCARMSGNLAHSAGSVCRCRCRALRPHRRPSAGRVTGRVPRPPRRARPVAQSLSGEQTLSRLVSGAGEPEDPAAATKEGALSAGSGNANAQMRGECGARDTQLQRLGTIGPGGLALGENNARRDARGM